jgi:hyperosmotically inducible periplasmic protein
MKKLLFMAVAAFTMLTFATSCKKKVSDADVQTAVTAALGKMTELKGGAVTVKDGVATVTGECMDQGCSDRCKKALEDLKIDGVKSVDWTCKLTPAPASLATTTADPKVSAAINAVLKDMPGVTVAYAAGKAIFSGTVNAKQKMAIAQACMTAKVAPDMTKVTIK